MQAPITYYVILRHYVICAHPGCESKHSAHTTFHRACFSKVHTSWAAQAHPTFGQAHLGLHSSDQRTSRRIECPKKVCHCQGKPIYDNICVNNESKIDMQGMPQPQRSNVQSMPYRLYRHPLPTCSRTPLGKALPA